MLRIKQLFRFAIPVIALPLFAGFSSSLAQFIVAHALGADSLMMINGFTQSANGLVSFLKILAIVCLGVSGMLSEYKKQTAAQRVHIVLFIVYVFSLMCAMIIYVVWADLLIPGAIKNIYGGYRELMAVYGGVVIFLTGTSALIFQLVKKYSMIMTLCLCGGIYTVGTVLIFFIPVGGLWMYGVAMGLIYSACHFLPFLMIPMALYYKSFSDSISEKNRSIFSVQEGRFNEN